MDCCNPTGYRKFFNSKEAQGNLDGYLKDGLNKMATRMASHLKDGSVTGASVIDVGCGIGAFHVELLQAGATSALAVEISAGYESAATDLLALKNLSSHVERIVTDFAEAGKEIPAADVVVLDRVVCCYPDWHKLLTSVTTHSTGRVAFSFPRDKWWNKLGLSLLNLYLRLRKVDFQTFIQPADQMLDLVESHGFSKTLDTSDLIWRGVVFER